MTIYDYLNDTWIPMIAEDREANTVGYYKRAIKDVCEHIGNIPIENINALIIEEMLRKIPPGSTRKRARKTFNTALNYAVRKRVIKENPMRYVDVSDKCPPAKKDSYTPDEAHTVLEHFEGTTVESAIVLSMLCGLRCEEVMGLDWKDIDVSHGMVHVRQAYVTTEKGPMVKGTKTPESERDAPLVGYALERMKILGKDRVGPVLVGRNGRMAPSSMAQTYRRHVRKLGIRYIPFENLRHTFATTALASGTDIGTLSMMLGHKRVSTTWEYIAVKKTEQKNASMSVSDAIMPSKIIDISQNITSNA